MTATGPDGQSISWEMQMFTHPNGDGTYSGVVLDSWGMSAEFTGHIENGEMVSEWTDEMTGMNMRGVETNNPDGGWTLHFFQQQLDGTWLDAGSVTYTRVTP